MAKIPIPFIGGAEGPRREPLDKGALETPYHPDATAEEGPPEPSPGLVEPDDQAVSSRPEPAAPVRIEVVDLDEAPGSGATEPDQDLEAEGPAGAAATAEETGISGAAAQELPDFLMGPDGSAAEIEVEGQEVSIEVGAESDDTLTGVVRLETAERLERLADDLMRGRRGDWIRTLIADLGPQRPEVAVPRAFAAGFLAAKAEEEKS